MRDADYDALRKRVLIRDRFKCWNCGEHATQVDHRWPVFLGGPDTEDNLRAACAHCNAKKAYRADGYYPGDEDPENECAHCHLGKKRHGDLCRACYSYRARRKTLPPQKVRP